LVTIRLKRVGTIKRPFYRIIVTDSRNPREGRFIEQVGLYQPIMSEDKQIVFDKEKIKKWFFQGAQPTHTVRKLLNKKGFLFDRAFLEKNK
jgi:small subunit ribosomal protein S16